MTNVLEAILIGGAPYDEKAEASKADIICRIREFRDVFGQSQYAELIGAAIQQCQEDRDSYAREDEFADDGGCERCGRITRGVLCAQCEEREWNAREDAIERGLLLQEDIRG